MQQSTQSILDNVLGLPVSNMGRASDLVWFHFGPQRTVANHFSGKPQVVAEWALHVQCPWRIVGPANIELASADMYYPTTTEGKVDLDDFDWDRPGKNLLDEKVAILLASRHDAPFVITHIEIDRVGSLKLLLDTTHSLEVFPSSSLPREQWRFFQPYQETPDLVLTGCGFER